MALEGLEGSVRDVPCPVLAALPLPALLRALAPAAHVLVSCVVFFLLGVGAYVRTLEVQIHLGSRCR